jgi:glutamate synthase domain-containing protein 2
MSLSTNKGSVSLMGRPTLSNSDIGAAPVPPSPLSSVIKSVREVTGKPTGFKSVIGATDWLDDLFQEINKRGEACAPDFMTLDSGDGGTGAAPILKT